MTLVIEFNCWQNGEYINFFIDYIQNHLYIRSHHIIAEYLHKNGLNRANTHDFNEISYKFLMKQIQLIAKAKKLGFIENFSKKTYKLTKRIQDFEILREELKKIKFNPGKKTFTGP